MWENMLSVIHLEVILYHKVDIKESSLNIKSSQKNDKPNFSVWTLKGAMAQNDGKYQLTLSNSYKLF